MQNDVLYNEIMKKIDELEPGGGGGRSSVFYEITTTNFPSGANTVGWFQYVKKSGDTYSYPDVLSSFSDEVSVNGNRTGCWMSNLVIPTLEDYFLAFVPNSGVTITASSGGIASTPITIYGTNHYIITDDFSITCSGWA